MAAVYGRSIMTNKGMSAQKFMSKFMTKFMTKLMYLGMYV